MPIRPLLSVGWRYLWRHPWQSILMILGITLGVAVVVSIDLANASASRAFDLSTQAVTGKTTHQITGGPGGLDQTIYVNLRRAGLQVPLAPVISEYITSPNLGNIPMQLLGVDPFAEPPFRSYLGSQTGDSMVKTLDFSDLLTKPGAILLPDQVASRFGLNIGQEINLEVSGRSIPVVVVGLIHADDELGRRALEGIILADISTVQESTGRKNKIDTIDVILPEGLPGERLAENIQNILSSGAELKPIANRSGAIQQMTAAFRLNLTALSLLALVVGMFLIYNTITFSVVQRREMFGILRSLGVTRIQVFMMVTGEALIVGLIGSSLGVLAGIVMGQQSVRLVAQTINDLFFVVNIQRVQIARESLIKGGALGIIASLLSTAPPAWEAASIPPRLAMSRSSLEGKTRIAVNLAALAGIVLIGSGFIILIFPSRSLLLSFGGTLAVVIGCALLMPLVTGSLMRLVTPLFGWIWGILGRMPPRNVIRSQSRTVIAVMALMVAISVTIGLSIMVHSFRYTVTTWLDETLQGDIYISAPGLSATTPTASIDPQIIEIARNWPGVERADVLRAVTVSSPGGDVNVAATDNRSLGSERIFLSTDISKGEIWSALLKGSVMVSEPFANRVDLPGSGGTIILDTPGGLREFPVVGIYYDYASTTGTVLMALPVYQQLWKDQEITAIQLRLLPDVQVDRVVRDLQASFRPVQRMNVQANRVLKQEALKVFDRTFAITGALQVLATFVAFVGILSALLSLELERQRELGILRSIGMTVGQVRRMILSETGLMGLIAGLSAIPVGYVLALILIFIINKRSFGWTLQINIDFWSFIRAILVAVVAALLAGIYPSFKVGKTNPSEALRSE